MSELHAETLAQTSAALQVWIAAVRIDDDRGDSVSADEAADLQIAVDAMAESLAHVCDEAPSSGSADYLPVHRARAVLVLLDRTLWAAQTDETAAPARHELIGAAEFAAAMLAAFRAAPTGDAAETAEILIARWKKRNRWKKEN